MKIIFLNDQAHINGGIGQVVAEEMQALARKGYQVFLFSCVPPIDNTFEAAGIEVCCLEQQEILNEKRRFKAMVKGIWNGQACRGLKKFLYRFNSKDTILHIHSWSKALSPATIHMAIRMQFKVVVTLHDYFIACPNGGFMDYPAASICKQKPLSWRCISRNCDARCFTHKIWRTARTLVQNEILRLPERVNHYIAVSNFCAEILRPYLPGKVKLDILTNPIDVPPCSPSNVATNDKFLFVGRFSREKGALTFAKVAAQLNVPTVFVGHGYLKKAIQNIYPRAEFTGWLSREKVRDQINRARALIFPSIWYETQGLVVVEAAAQGVPVVTSDTSAAIDFIEDQKTGLYFKAGDVDDLYAKMTMLKDGNFATELGVAAYKKYWKTPWSIEKHTQKLISIYQEVLNS